MRRVRLPLGRRLFVIVVMLAALLLTLPLRIAAGALGLGIAEYTVGPVFGTTRGHHRWLVEPTAPTDPGLVGSLARALDAALILANDDYAVHRRGGQMGPPEVTPLPPGAFARWMRAQGKLGGQHKVPRVLADPARFAAAEAGLLG